MLDDKSAPFCVKNERPLSTSLFTQVGTPQWCAIIFTMDKNISLFYGKGILIFIQKKTILRVPLKTIMVSVSIYFLVGDLR